MKRIVLAGVVVAFFASTVLGQLSTGNSVRAVRARVPETLKNLSERINEVSFQDAPLDQVMSWLSGLTPMNVVVRWQVLEDAGIERDKPITMQVHELRLSQVLWMILDEAGGTDITLAYRASGNLLIISTAEDLGKEMVVKVYDVSDLLVKAQDFYGAPHMDLSNQQNNQGQGGGGSIFSNSSGGGSNLDNQQQQGRNGENDNADIKELINLIVQTVEPDSWADNGGNGTIQPFRNLLVVRNNLLVHQQIGGYVQESR